MAMQSVLHFKCYRVQRVAYCGRAEYLSTRGLCITGDLEQVYLLPYLLLLTSTRVLVKLLAEYSSGKFLRYSIALLHTVYVVGLMRDYARKTIIK